MSFTYCVLKMNTVDKQYIVQLLGERKTYQDIRDILTEEYPGVRGFSVESVNKFCKKNGLSSRRSQQTLDTLVSDAVKEVCIQSHFKVINCAFLSTVVISTLFFTLQELKFYFLFCAVEEAFTRSQPNTSPRFCILGKLPRVYQLRTKFLKIKLQKMKMNNLNVFYKRA